MAANRQEADRIFDQLDTAHSGHITRAQFEGWMRQRQNVQQTPQPIKMVDPAPAPVAAPIVEKKVYGVISDDMSEEVRFLKDARRAFALAGPLLICVLAFIPVCSALALMHSRTYLYFSGWGSPIGGLLLLTVILVAVWMNCIMGVGCPVLPIPNPFRIFEPLWQRLRAIPTEAYVMLFTTIVLMIIWKLVPIIAMGGIMGALHWLGSFVHLLDFMWFNSTPAATVLACAFAAVVLYVLSLNYFFARAKPEARGNVMNLFAIWSVFVLLMGAAFMLLSMPISYEADKASNELMLSCETGPRTRDLFVTSQALQALRQSAGCATVYSVEDCNGFQPTKFTSVLKSMEHDYKCAGFCYNPAVLDGASPTAAGDSYEYPPTLFTLANYQASCDGMAARNMQHFVGVIGRMVFNQGVICVVIAVVMALMFMLSICGAYRQKESFFSPDGHSAYGSM